MSDLLPWQQVDWATLQARVHQGRLPHALLLTGRAGLGKYHFARAFATALLCAQPDAQGLACGQCRSCTLLAAGSHPDYLEAMPEEPGKAIKIDQVRALIASLRLTSQYNGYKIAILSPAEAMNRAAANSLLKTLEEPRSDTLLCLCSHEPTRLPATIRSRCQRLTMQSPARDTALGWLRAQSENGLGEEEGALLLELTGGAPLAAHALAEQGALAQRQTMLQALQGVLAGTHDPIAIAQDWLKLGLDLPLYWLYRWVTDLIRLQLDGQAPISNRDQRDALQDMGERVDSRWLFRYLDTLHEAMRAARGQANAQLVLESLLSPWARVATVPHRAQRRR